MIAYKLLRVRSDGTLGSLFINRKAVLPVGLWLFARTYVNRRFAPRCGWHALPQPSAPHLSTKGRRWYRVLLGRHVSLHRPAHQGGTWLLAESMKILGPVS